MRPSLRSRARAFSMIEILFVIAVISLMVALTMPALAKTKSYAEYVRWATMSHSIQTDPDLTFYLNFQDQLDTSAELWNKAAGPALGMNKLETTQFAMAAAPGATAIDGLGQILPNLLVGALSDPSDLNGTFGDPNSPANYEGDDPKWVRGRWEHKKALAFDYKSLIYGTNHPQLDLGTSDFTITYWFKVENWNSYGGIIFARIDGKTKEGFYIALEGDADVVKPIMHVGKRDGYGVDAYIPYLDKGESLGDGQWHQLVWVRKGDRMSTWIDGEQNLSRFHFPHDLSANAVYTLGNGDIHGYNSFYSGFPGAIDEFGVYRRALSDKEITDAYLAGKPQMSQDEIE